MTRAASGTTAASAFIVAGVALPVDGAQRSITRRLTSALRAGIQVGRLPSGLALPPSRTLAAELGCSRWVVTETYGQLVAEGYLEATTGSATRVRALHSGAVQEDPPGPPPLPPLPKYDLSPGLVDLGEFPRTRWTDAYRRAVLTYPVDHLSSQSMAVTLSARSAITDYLRRTRGVREDPTQLSLSTGTSAAAGWLARMLCSLGHRSVAVEDPSWPGLRDAARRAGLRPVPVGVDEQGLLVGELAQLGDTRAVITTPSHQFPTGVAMSAARRLALIEWAERVDGLIIEDDYDSEFRFDQQPIASLQGMAPHRVALVGSLSKSLGPKIDLGWVTLPQWLIRSILANDLDRGTAPSGFTVDAFAAMIRTGAYERHVRSSRLRYRRRRHALLAAIAEFLPHADVTGAAAGLHLVLELPPGTVASRVVRRAADLEVRVVDLDRYRIRPNPAPALVIGYGNVRTGRERAAIARLAQAISHTSTRS